MHNESKDLEITSKRSAKFFVSYMAVAAMVFLLASAMVYVFFRFQGTEAGGSKIYFLLIVILFVYGLFWNLVYTYFLNSPKIKIDREKIVISQEIYYWKDLVDIDLMETGSFNIFHMPCAAFQIRLLGKRKVVVFDEMYANGHHMKMFLEQIILQGQEKVYVAENKIDAAEVRLETFKVFKGNILFSLRTITFSLMLGFCLYVLVFYKIQALEGKIYLITLSLASFVFAGTDTYYFKISKNYLIVQNHIFFWKKKIFRITDLRITQVEAPYRLSARLSMIENNFKRRSYKADTLSGKMWTELKSELKRKRTKLPESA